jgi:hypothetical protein
MAITKKRNLSELIGLFAASIGFSRALERSIGVCDGFALGVLHRARCRLVMKLRLGE